MARPKSSTPPRVGMSLRLAPETVVWLDAEAARRGISRHALAVRCIERVQAASTGAAPVAPNRYIRKEATPIPKGGKR